MMKEKGPVWLTAELSREPLGNCGPLPPSALNGLGLTRTTFEVECHTPLYLEDFVGNALRGDFGFMLRHRACKGSQTACRDRCAGNCTYGQVFAPVLAQGEKTIQPPRPYLFEVQDMLKTVYRAGEVFRFRLLLIGRAQHSLEFLSEVIEALGRRGLGEGHRAGLGRFTIVTRHVQTITEDDFAARAAQLGTLLHPPGASLNVHFLTPAYINQCGDGPLHFAQLWDSLVTRCKSLARIYGGVSLDESISPADFRTLKEWAKDIRKTGDTLMPRPQRRDSGSQRRPVQAGGLVGSVSWSGNLLPFLPLLCAGEWLHAGKDTVLGNGLFRLSAT
jgi:hypothetical protein